MTERSTHDQVRRAVPDDAEELTRLRALMFRDMGRPAWRRSRSAGSTNT